MAILVSVFVFGVLVAAKLMVWWLLPDGRLKTALFRYRGTYDPQPPPGDTKHVLDDPTIVLRRFRKH